MLDKSSEQRLKKRGKIWLLKLLEFRTEKGMKLGDGFEISEEKKDRRNRKVTGVE